MGKRLLMAVSLLLSPFILADATTRCVNGQTATGRATAVGEVKHTVTVEITSPTSQSEFRLSEGNFTKTPDIAYKAKVTIDGTVATTAPVNWTLDLTYDTTTSRGPFTDHKTFTTSQPNVAYTQPFISEGGKVTLNATTTYAGKSYSATPVIVYVLGQDIPVATVKTRLTALYAGPTDRLLVGICVEETTTIRQYDATLKKYGITGGWPLESNSDHGSHIGLMQVPVAMAVAWDWLQNTQGGADMFATLLTQSDNHVRRLKRTNKNLPDLTGVQRENNALSLYRSGGYYYVPNGAKNGWVTNPQNATGVNYADRVRTKIPPE
jgi:hypothetical protein